ncbi:uncharacterized protein MELLADRAFT_107571 [Melampsora larici-populina 98AG31]|uniref:Secreted protein n=1 Tax=Melampsora larici-populina (strain 98AG31 / pathotype 3-4-7) TaxID=747676 RepID=F4RQ31_MELLP|nr:uncharacterized protein MELLADRAFT_107571 [Melampsora larici-populina 98AG31]EGG05336.1 hypothetical protein MELLADRAFT_107571 [Melampsora larici-populina 98AG31]
MARMYAFVRLVIFLSSTFNLTFAAVQPHRADTVRKPLRLNTRDLSSTFSNGLPSHVNGRIEIEGFEVQRESEYNGLAELQNMFGGHHDDHSFMMISTNLDESDDPFRSESGNSGTMNIEMMMVDFGESEGNQIGGSGSIPTRIEIVKSVKRIIPPSIFHTTLRAQQVTDHTRERLDRLKTLAGMSGGYKDPFARLFESLGAAVIEMDRDPTSEPSERSEPSEPSVPTATQTEAEKPKDAPKTALPTLIQKAPQSQNTFQLSEDKTTDNFNVSHHNQL